MSRPLKRENLAERLKKTPLFVVTNTPRHPLDGDHNYAFAEPAQEIIELWPDVPESRPSVRRKWREFLRKIARAIRHR